MEREHPYNYGTLSASVLWAADRISEELTRLEREVQRLRDSLAESDLRLKGPSRQECAEEAIGEEEAGDE